mgnify:CR=1 FL=1
MEKDKDTIALTEKNQLVLAEIMALGWFPEKMDVARFCLAYAVRAKVAEGASRSETAETRWAAAMFDKSGEIRALLGALYPNCQTPVRLMEHLVNEGFRMIATRIKTDGLGPGDLMD